MRSVVIGLGIQGKKRLAIAGADAVATVDPVAPGAQYQSIEQVPLDSYDAALACVPDAAKFELLHYLLSHGKHVLVEKPLLSPHQEQIRELLELSRANKVACYTAYNHRFEPHIVHLKNYLESGALGRAYFAKFFYGNGTARDVQRSPWRDKGMGVLPDLGSHLLDMTLFLFGPETAPFAPLAFHCFENKAYDHVLFSGQGQPAITFEATLLSWRNSFYAEVYGEKGSAHVHCLCKWGPSTLTVRQRILPSGKPTEQAHVLEQPDPTWALEYRHFCELAKTGGTNLENDLWINSTLLHLGQSVGQGLAA